MLYEVLAGRRPHPAESLQELAVTRLRGPATPLRSVAPGVPGPVADVIDRLLAVRPQDRPATVWVAVAELFDDSGSSSVRRRPFVGRQQALAEALACIESGSSICLSGPAGAGRSRFLDELVAVVGAERVGYCMPATAAFASLRAVLRDALPPDTLDLRGASLWVSEQLKARLEAGDLLLIDELDQLDSWSVEVLQGAVAWGSIVCANPLPGEQPVALEPLEASDLRGLFAGPERILHLPEDAAEELHRRTGGVPARVVAELDAWARTRLGTFDDEGCFVLDRVAIERLRADLRVVPSEAVPVSRRTAIGTRADTLGWAELAWPIATVELLASASSRPRWAVEADVEALHAGGWLRELPGDRFEATGARQQLASWTEDRRAEAHRALADHIPVDEPTRFRHLVAVGSAAEVAAAALQIAERAVQLGSLGRAEAVLTEGLAALRREAVDDGPALEARLDLAFLQGTERALEQVRYDLRRAVNEDVGLPLLAVVEGALSAYRGGGTDVIEALGALGALPSARTNRWRHAARVIAARSCDLATEQALLDELEGWAEAGGVEERAALAGWQGGLRYREGRYAEAAQQHLESAAQQPLLLLRLGAQLNAGSALLEAGDLDAASEAADRARDDAGRLRHSLFEARAEWLFRTASYRAGRLQGADRPLLGVIEALGLSNLLGMAALTEAAAAWRAGDPAAVELAELAEGAWERTRRSWGTLLARSLAVACGRPVDASGLEELAQKAKQCPDATIGAQVLGLLALGSASSADDFRSRASQLIAGRQHEDVRLDVLSLAECCVGLAPPA